MTRKGISILLVDGDETLQGLRTLMLRLRGYRVERVATLDDARRSTAAQPFGLVLIDVQRFPGLGLEFCEEMKAAHPGIKVAFLANHTLYLPPQSCPDEVIARQDGPEQFLTQVDELVGASA
jgi:DNA-binding NtrC family response regulator